MKELVTRIPVAPEGMPVTDIYSESAQFPGMAVQNGAVYVHYQAFKNRHDTLKVGVLGEDGLKDVQTISGEGEVLYPVSLAHDGATWFAWSEAKDRQWSVLARFVKDGVWSETIVVDHGEAVLYPCLYAWNGDLYIMWTRQYKNGAQAVTCALSEAGAGEAEVISASAEAYRANACQGGDGNLYVTYDAYRNGGYDVMARVKTAAGWSEEIRVDQSEDWVCAPRIMPAPTGATVCWYTFGYGATFGVYASDLTACDGALCAAPVQTLTENVGWYMDLAVASNSKGLQAVAYTWGKDKVQVRVRQAGGSWTEGAQMSYEDIHCAMYPSLLVGEDGTICMAWQFAFRNGHYDRNAQAVITRFTAEDVEKRQDPSTEHAENNFCIPIAAEKHLDRRTDEEVAEWLKKNGYTGKLLFGDIHGQSGISDGMGKIDQYYRRSRAKANLQFSCLTDHDCYPDWISQSEWELMRTTAHLMDTDNELTCILSFEWTPNEYQYDFGHKNVYFRDDDGDIFRSGDKSGITPTDLYASIKKYRAMCIPHHPAADWGMVSAATDWSFHDDQVERLAEIYSRHAPYEDFESRSKYTKNIKKFPRRSVQDALARGYRMGFTAGSDSHQMEHGVEGGIVAIYTPTHDRAGIWDAMYDRRTYGTTGARILLSFKAEGQPMGSEIKVPEGKPVQFEISVLGTKTVKVELLKNNQVIQTWEPGSDACDVTWADSDRSASDYYYVRVTQPDEHMAWSSPIWVDKE